MGDWCEITYWLYHRSNHPDSLQPAILGRRDLSLQRLKLRLPCAIRPPKLRQSHRSGPCIKLTQTGETPDPLPVPLSSVYNSNKQFIATISRCQRRLVDPRDCRWISISVFLSLAICCRLVFAFEITFACTHIPWVWLSLLLLFYLYLRDRLSKYYLEEKVYGTSYFWIIFHEVWILCYTIWLTCSKCVVEECYMLIV